MKWMTCAVAALMLSGSAFADDQDDAQKEAAEQTEAKPSDSETAKPTVDPRTGQLPTTASDHARDALNNTAFGKKGAAERAAHAQAKDHAKAAATDSARDEAAKASAHETAKELSRKAAAEARAKAARANAANGANGAQGTAHRPAHP